MIHTILFWVSDAGIICGGFKKSAMQRLLSGGIVLLMLLSIGCGRVSSSDSPVPENKESAKRPMNTKPEYKLATFAGGCFWCTEAVFQRLKGVGKVVSGYSGGHVDNPTYEQVCAGSTGHAESIQISYDPALVSFDQLLEVFWKTHDPTTKNRQGNDFGPQYRSVIFYHDAEQEKLAEAYKSKLGAEHIWDKPIVTEIVPFTKFWPAENYHQNYYNNNLTQGYCTLVITPKIEKFKKIFKDRLK
jgi:peptide-methionine (S)-S-oxide reductase